MKFIIAFAIALLLSAATSAQPVSAQSTYLPQGSWQDSCRNPHMRGSTLVAQCRADNDAWVRTSLDTSQCSNGQISNQNGSLVCDRGGAYYRGNDNRDSNYRGNGRSSNAMPAGSWSDSCVNSNMRGSVLVASCRNDRGDYRPASLDVNQCRASFVANRNGSLVCQNGQR
jgi:hypothetical protein